MLWSGMGGQVLANASVVCRGGYGTQADFLYLLYISCGHVGRDGMGLARSSSGRSLDRGMLNILSGMIVNYFKCARCACVWT